MCLLLYCYTSLESIINHHHNHQCNHNHMHLPLPVAHQLLACDPSTIYMNFNDPDIDEYHYPSFLVAQSVGKHLNVYSKFPSTRQILFTISAKKNQQQCTHNARIPPPPPPSQPPKYSQYPHLSLSRYAAEHIVYISEDNR